MVHFACPLDSEEQQHDSSTMNPPPAQRSMLSALLASQSNSLPKSPVPEHEHEHEHETIDESMGMAMAPPSTINTGTESQSPAHSHASSNSLNETFNRTTKVAKTKYSDHGAHAVTIVDEESETSQHVSDDNYNDHDHDDAGIGNSINSKDGGHGLHHHHDSSSPLTPQKRASPGFRNPKGKPTSLLHAALTQKPQTGIAGELAKNSGLDGSLHSHSHSQHSQQTGIAGELAKNAGLDGSLHTHSNTNTNKHSKHSHVHEKEKPPTRGECLTNPSEPISNDGADNVEGNLIVHTNDLFKVPNRKVHYHSIESDSFLNNNDPLGVTTFQVVGLLGQGTFAQVFQCKNLETGKMCAVKIVKNKPAYTRQATIEIEVFKTMMKKNSTRQGRLDITAEDSTEKKNVEDFMVSLLCYFMYKSHLCLVFELLGQNLYELLKQRQFRGLPIRIVKDVVKQAVSGVTELSNRKIVHCDLKPENILLVSSEMSETLANAKFKVGKDESTQKEIGNTIKLIDFGSACFEESSGFTYIQSRFYRSPEVLVGVNYDSAIDMWSLGCVAAELFLGLPILPGVNELDQLGRIQEMIGPVPEWMLDQG